MNRQQLTALAALKEAFNAAVDTGLGFEGHIMQTSGSEISDFVTLDIIYAVDGNDQVDILEKAYVTIEKDELVRAMKPYIEKIKGKRNE